MRGLSGATMSAPLGCRGLPRGAVGGGGGRAGRAEAERWRRVGAGRRMVDRMVRCVATEKHDEKAGAAVGVEFADEEDYRKAGGGELLFVQMQATKPMDSQSKIASKLLPISDEILDLVIIGCGPAGLSLASESAKKGLNVGLIGPDLPFTNNYGVWEDEFKDLGLASCIEHVWKDTIVYLDGNKPILIGRSYGRVHRDLLHEELLRRCFEAGVTYLNSKVDKIIESPDGHRVHPGRLLEYEVGGPPVCVQTAYGVEVEVENNPYDPSLMVFMDYRDCFKDKFSHLEEENPTFLMWRGFLGSTLSSVDLILFSFYMFAIAPNKLRMNLVRHLLSDPTGSTMIKTYLTL
ncbi:hypothetical protein PR202_gb05737 [Eleusine coracana subsp. coracana]|uniref:Lycopene epsilon cyclase n=1 Tax=Eleusine coracana subsp. coracana TaxID=191504 RepID=A0AAV5E8J5_ELECO|nr:hypothetical protein PR202_gb05737 [Eleusine coracana subsp. coracana]